MEVSEERLTDRLRSMGERASLTLEDERWTRLATYVALLFRWNAHMNLTALDSGDRGLERLVIEPLVAARYVPPGARSMVDIGSGGGSPAIPMKIARPGLSLRMVESRVRKAAFLRHAVRELKLGGVEVENCRYEALVRRPEMRQAHDVVTVRGVRIADGDGGLRDLLKPGGLVLAFRSGAQGRIGNEAGLAAADKEWVLLEGAGSELVIVSGAAGK